MTNILRKKIENSTGIPPSIHNAEEFWNALEGAVDAWLLRGLEEISGTRVLKRKVLTGEEASNSGADESVVFNMTPVADYGLSSITLSHGLAVRFAARRMHQSVEGMTGTSDLFLALISEDPAMLLRESVKAHLGGSRHDFERGISVDLLFNVEELAPAMRYIQVSMECSLEGEMEQVQLLFGFNALKNYLATRFSGSRSATGSSKLIEHGLIGNSVQKSDVCVYGIIDRIPMNIGACSRLKVGQVLPLVTADKEAIIVAVDTVSGCSGVSKGRLGIWKKRRAIKLSAPISENFVRDLVGF